MQLRVPGRGTIAVEKFQSRIPKPEEIAIVPPAFLKCTRRIAMALKGSDVMWAVGGDTGLVLHGVPIDPDRLEIITTKEGANKILATLSGGSIATEPEWRETRFGRDAEIEGIRYPLRIRSYFLTLEMEGVDIDIHGDKQFKVGDWEWGDPLEFTPDVSLVMGVEANLVPLRLESEFAFGLGWDDLAKKIAETISKQRHRGMMDSLPPAE